MKSRSTRRAAKQRGAYLVEYSLVILVFLFVLLGIMEFGRIVTAYNILSGATREGTRYAIVHGSRSGVAATASDVQDQVRRWCIGLDASGPPLSGTALSDRRVALVLGAEGEGMRRLTRETCDAVAGIGQSLAMESLNVSAAAAIALYEITRKE